jgi:hypothetical protein
LILTLTCLEESVNFKSSMRIRKFALVASSIVSLIAAFLLLALSIYNRKMEAQMVKKQEELSTLRNEVNRGITSKDIAQSIIQDLAVMSNSKPEVATLLSKIGIVVNRKTPSNP